jgi:hypothetical protein
MNRSACHLRLGNHDACIRDTTDGLSLIEAEESAIQESIRSGESSSNLPDSLANQRTARKVKLLVRRGTARVWSQTSGTMLAQFKDGVDDYRAALELDSNNEALRADVVKLEARFDELCKEFEQKLDVMNDYTRRAEIR